ncbi:MAG: tannase/feruloyl esterase family alpha/beta hydrolase [Acidobacteriota bacterium]|nr:tannase/feruloyl esterase family alpha/beta hydrolase [Acidobacteriota bacterium]
MGQAGVLTARATAIGLSLVGALSLPAWSDACAELSTLDLPQTRITLAVQVAAGFLDPPGRTPPLEELGAICRVVGVTEPEVRFEVWMPVVGWNGKFNGVGNGGMAGTISFGAMAAAVARGYATASTDTGHVASGNAFDASWALGRPDLIEDFGHRALHLTTVHAKKIVERYYGSAPRHSYYTGCSKGGQQGLMEAQRYPEDYDGIVAGNPANDWTRFYLGAHLWYALATLDDQESYISPEKAKILGAAVNEACDTIDGIADGVLDDPRLCKLDPASLVCPAGHDGHDCLSAKQAAAVAKIWGGSKDSNGETIYPGLVPGGEGSAGGWSTWVTGADPFRGLHWLAAEGFLKNFVFDDPNWNFRTFDYERDLPIAMGKLSRALDSTDPDLRQLEERGAKLIVYHGWADPDISPLASIDYYDSVVDELGPRSDRTAVDRTRDFFRLFLVPGMGHCRGGPGTDRFDALSALESWVERGEAPNRIIASRMSGDDVERTRPLCPYPQVARWDGRGSTDEAASFRCESP